MAVPEEEKMVQISPFPVCFLELKMVLLLLVLS